MIWKVIGWIALRNPFARAIEFCPCGAALNVGLGSKELSRW